MTRLVAALLAFVLVATTLYAHHASSGMYDDIKDARSMANYSTGNVAEFKWLNPHTLLYLETGSNLFHNRAIEILEWLPPNALLRQGVTRDSVKKGDHLIVAKKPLVGGKACEIPKPPGLALTKPSLDAVVRVDRIGQVLRESEDIRKSSGGVPLCLAGAVYAIRNTETQFEWVETQK